MQQQLPTFHLLLSLLLLLPVSIVRCQVVVSPHWPSTSPFLAYPPLSVLPSDYTTFSWWLPLQNLEWLRSEYEAVSDPKSPRYLDFHSSEQITAKVNPSHEAVVAPVLAFLTSGDIPLSNITQVNAQLQVTAQISVLESLFGVTFQLYRATNQSNVSFRRGGLLRTNESVTIPSSVAPYLTLLKDINDLPAQLLTDNARRAQLRSSLSLSQASSSLSRSSSTHSFTVMSPSSSLPCETTSAFATPQFIGLQCGYNPASVTVPANAVKLAVIGGFYETNAPTNGYEYYSPTDLSLYASNLGYSITSPSINPFFNQDTGYTTIQSGTPLYEANLDIQQAFAFCPQCSIGLYPVSQANANNGFTSIETVYNAILAMNSTAQPHIVSLSYGVSDSSYSSSQIATLETIFMQLAAAGVTNLASSGDNGANNAGTGCSSSTLAVEYPASSQYVTGVGATEYFNGVTSNNVNCLFSSTSDVSGSNDLLCGQCPSGGVSGTIDCQTGTAAPQRAVKPYTTGSDLFVSGFSSGGGFSSQIAQPTAQKAAVAAYLNTYCTSAYNCALPATGYNPAYRGVPDVSFYGSLSGVGFESELTFLVGTSVSAPAFGGLLANLVQYYQTATGTTTGLGDIKAFLYQAQANTSALAGPLQAFSDVTVGDNICPAPISGNTACKYTGCTGYQTAPGWDPVTGLGTPYLPALICFLANTTKTSDAATQCAYALSGAPYMPFGTNSCPTSSTGSPMTSIPVTSPLVTSAPVTSPLITSAPATSPLITSAPATSPIVTSAPATSPLITSAPATSPLVTSAPATSPLLTSAPVTSPLITSAPVTSPLITSAPATSPLVTSAPATSPLITSAPATSPVITSAPATSPLITSAPATSPLITSAPVTSPLVTSAPATSPLVTSAPATSPVVTSTPATSPVVTSTPATSPLLTSAPATSPLLTSTPATSPVVTSAPVSITASVSSSTAGSAVSDPEFHGFWGQSFMVGGDDGLVYNIISDAEVQVNSLFITLSNIECPQEASEAVKCANHTGSYFGELYIHTTNGDQLHIVGGPTLVGFGKVMMNDRTVSEGQSVGVPVGVDEEGKEGAGVIHSLHRSTQSAASSQDTLGNTEADHSSRQSIYAHRLSSRRLEVHAGVYEMLIENSDRYVDFVNVRISCWDCLSSLQPEGLLGRTWQLNATMPPYEEHYREQDSDIKGNLFANNKFARETTATTTTTTISVAR